MSAFHLFSDLPEKTLFKGFHARLVHTDQMTISYLRIDAGAELPEHRHPHEQITNILEGELEMTIGGETQVCKPGMTVTIAPNVPHSGRALTDCIALDIFTPVREDYK